MESEMVKKEVEDGDLNNTAPLGEQNSKSAAEEDVTLAQLSAPNPKPRPISFSAGKLKISLEKSETRIKFKRRCSGLKIDHAISDHAGKCICCKQNKAENDGSSTPREMKSSPMIRAEEVQSNLEPAFPSFVKCLVRSHVASCFWMGLPGPFCRAHLPHEDATVTLEDECGKEFKMKYIGYKTGLSAGWRQFSVAHQLLEGDVLVFQLIEPCKFKVYVIRANDLTEVDGALGLLNLDAQSKQNDTDIKLLGENTDNAEMASVICKSTKRKRPKSLPLAIVQKKNKKSGKRRSSVRYTRQSTEHSENDSEEVGSEVLEGFKLNMPAIRFEDIQSFENFKVLVDGLVLDSELSEDVRSKYYKLCCSQNEFLHENLIKGINFKLISGLIIETVNIADAIRACNLTTSRDEFIAWEETLKASEHFGMNVGFLRSRLSQIVSLAFDSEGATRTRRYIEARIEKSHTEDEIRNLEEKLLELKAAHERYGADIESLKSKAESYEVKFQEEVLAPW